jgi:putative ABC transport system ATP-binding protein
MLVVRRLAAPGVQLERLDLAAGEVVAVCGPSGAGKTLLLRALADLDDNSGEVTLDGIARGAMAAPAWRRRVTYLAAESAWWADTVGEHLQNGDAAGQLLDAVGLARQCRDWPIARLSTGERQRLALVRALVLDPRVLLLDEPTASLDAEAAGAVERLLAVRQAAGTSALWVTHDDDQAKRVASRGVLVRNGVAAEIDL